MATIRGFTKGTVIVFSTPGGQGSFPPPAPSTAEANNQPESEAAGMLPQLCGFVAEYSGPLTPEMSEMGAGTI